MITAFDAETWGTGGAGVGAGFPLPVHLPLPEPAADATTTSTPTPGPQRAMRAPGHPQGCFHTEMLMDELADALKMDPLEFRMKNLPPEAPNAMWRKYFPIAAEMFGWSKRHPTGDPTPGPIKRGVGCAANQWGGGGRGTQGALRDHIRRQRRHPMRHAGHRRRHANASSTMITAETLGVPMDVVKAEIGDTQLSVQRRVRRQHDSADRSRRPFASPPGRRSTR